MKLRPNSSATAATATEAATASHTRCARLRFCRPTVARHSACTASYTARVISSDGPARPPEARSTRAMSESSCSVIVCTPLGFERPGDIFRRGAEYLFQCVPKRDACPGQQRLCCRVPDAEPLADLLDRVPFHIFPF